MFAESGAYIRTYAMDGEYVHIVRTALVSGDGENETAKPK